MTLSPATLQNYISLQFAINPMVVVVVAVVVGVVVAVVVVGGGGEHLYGNVSFVSSTATDHSNLWA